MREQIPLLAKTVYLDNVGAVAASIPFRHKDNVIVGELNFPTNIYLWHTLKKRPTKRSESAQSLKRRGVAVSVDYVSWINGC